jgi:hypothetical protein
MHQLIMPNPQLHESETSMSLQIRQFVKSWIVEKDQIKALSYEKCLHDHPPNMKSKFDTGEGAKLFSRVSQPLSFLHGKYAER